MQVVHSRAVHLAFHDQVFLDLIQDKVLLHVTDHGVWLWEPSKYVCAEHSAGQHADAFVFPRILWALTEERDAHYIKQPGLVRFGRSEMLLRFG